MAYIIWIRGSGAGRRVVLEQAELLIGRSAECGLMLNNALASRRHARITASGQHYTLYDCESANGTLLNGRTLTRPTQLRHGDVFTIGDDQFRFEEERAQAQTVLRQLPARPQAAAARHWLPILSLLLLVVLVLAFAGTQSQLLPDTLRQPISAALSNPLATILPRTANSNNTAGAPTSQAEWTLLVYLAGDNDLEADALADLNEMELAGSSAQVNVLVQLDRMRGERPGLFAPESWTTVRRYRVSQDQDRTRVASPVLADLGELNTGDPQTLADFMLWGMRSYPARHYALVIWDHGSAWAGIAFDDSSQRDGLTLPEIDSALRTVQAQTGVDRLDVIGFDACMMAQLDVLLTVAPYGRVAIASADLEPNTGWPWDQVIAQLNAAPDMDATALGKVMVASYQSAYTAPNQQAFTLAAFDLQALPAIRDTLGLFADAMLVDMRQGYRAIAEARSYATVYSQPQPDEFSAVDLSDLARLAMTRTSSDVTVARAQALIDAITAARIAFWSSDFHQQAGGLSIFFPQIRERYPLIYADISPLALQTAWPRFLTSFYDSGDGLVSVPQISNLAVQAQPTGGAILTGTVAGQDIAHVFFFIGTPHADRQGVQLSLVEYVAPPGNQSDGPPSWPAQASVLTQQWDGLQWALSNGSETIPVLLGPARYGENLYGVEGRFQAQGAEPIDAALLFQRNGNAMLFQAIYGFARGQNQEVQPFQISPQPGDQFTVQLRNYTDRGSQLELGKVDGATLRFTEQPLQAVHITTPPGDYVAGFLVRDISGRYSYQYRDIRISP